MFKTFLASLALGAVLAGSATAATVVNGSFEQPGSFSGSFLTINAPSPYLPGWNLDAGSVDLINTYWQSADGSYNLDMTGNSPATISQTVTGLTANAKYTLSFALAGNPDSAPTVKTLRASVGAATEDFTFDITGKSHGNMGWVTETLAFTATASSMLLSFQSLDAGYWGPALDNVAIEPASVPVPAAGLLLAGALGMLGLKKRRRA